MEDGFHTHTGTDSTHAHGGGFHTGAVELQLGGGAPPCVSEGLLGFLIEAVAVKAAQCTQTEGNRGRVVRLQRAVGSVNGRICEEGALLNVTYLILVSEPLTRRASAIAVIPSAV